MPRLLISKPKPKLSIYQHNLLGYVKKYPLLEYRKNCYFEVKRKAITKQLGIRQEAQNLILNKTDGLSPKLDLEHKLDQHNQCLEWIYNYVNALREKFLDIGKYELKKYPDQLEVHLYKSETLLCIYKYINQPIGLKKLSFIVNNSYLSNQKLFLFFAEAVLTKDIREWLNQHEKVIRYLVYDIQTHSFSGRRHDANNSVSFKLEICTKSGYTDKDLISYLLQ